MTKNPTPVLLLQAAYEFGNRHGLRADMQAIREMNIEWDESYTSSVRRGYVLKLLIDRDLLDAFKRECWPGSSTATGQQKEASYHTVRRRYEDSLAGRRNQNATGRFRRARSSASTRKRSAVPRQSREPVPNTFEEYLRAAVAFALAEESSGRDKGAFRRRLDGAARGVKANWSAITSQTFVCEYLRCVGSIQKKYKLRMDTTHGPSYWERQLKLFRDGDAEAIVTQEQLIRAEWGSAKVYLSPKMVDATLHTATQIVDLSWGRFKNEFLPLPADPTSERLADWKPVLSALKELRMVKEAIAPYLVRNLYGGAFLKPDVHIQAIARHYFGHTPDPIAAMATAARLAWSTVLPGETPIGLREPNLGIIDYVLWFYRQATGLP